VTPSSCGVCPDNAARVNGHPRLHARRQPASRWCFAALLSGAAFALLPAAAAAQQTCTAVAPPQQWPSPLDRRIAIRARDVSLREALDRIAAAARFRVSYSAEFVPLDRRVCLTSDSIVAGDALAELLTGVSVTPIATANDYVVIAPSHPVPRVARESVQTLERVVVTGSAVGSSRRPLSIALDVIDRHKLDQQATGTLASSLDGNVAGMWVWEQSPSTLLARYGSIRGASSFNVSYPKVYIDGIEVANPLLLTDLNTATLERVEVIRGPQGAALYGADAISGVINIVTRHEGLEAGASRLDFASRAGLSQTAFAENSVLAQNHSMNWRAGSNVKSGSLGLNVTSLGGYVPEAYSRDVKLNGAFRVVSSAASVTGSARFYGKRAAPGQNPLIIGFLPAPSASIRARDGVAAGASLSEREDSLARLARDSVPQSVREYTAGITSTLLSGTTWTPSFTAGVDGYRLSNVPNELGVVPSALDSALHSAQGGADKATFRTSLVGYYDLGARRALTVTFSGEHSVLRETLSERQPTSSDDVSRFRDVIMHRSNTGIVGQGNFSFRDALYLTGGLRVERNGGFTLSDKTVALPMAGISLVRDVGKATFKFRSAYGVGIRPTRTPSREAALHDIRQYGIGSSKRLAYVLQNVGEITNRGWELESSYETRGLSLAGAFTTVDSRVRHIAPGYTGDLLVGARMLAVPAGTASLTASWNLFGWGTSLTASRAFDWINYDRLRTAKDYASCDSCSAETITGAQLRTYWISYDGVTRLRASASRELRGGLGVRLAVDNLTNQQRGEPDNITVLPGRTVLFGLTAKIR
jgi:outer membrane receptor protein involved in Fe transport